MKPISILHIHDIASDIDNFFEYDESIFYLIEPMLKILRKSSLYNIKIEKDVMVMKPIKLSYKGVTYDVKDHKQFFKYFEQEEEYFYGGYVPTRKSDQ